MFIDFRERGREMRDGERERERNNIDVREKHWLVASHMYPDRGSNPQLRYVPWPGIELLTFWCMAWHCNQPSQCGIYSFLTFCLILFIFNFFELQFTLNIILYQFQVYSLVVRQIGSRKYFPRYFQYPPGTIYCYYNHWLSFLWLPEGEGLGQWVKKGKGLRNTDW